MEYIFLAYVNDRQWEQASAFEHAAYLKACRVNDDVIEKNGYSFAAARIQNSAATIVRIQDGKIDLTGSLSKEIEEQLAAVYFINARDLNDAIRVASQMPQARRGFIEVRAILE